jgi:hypothetical protein
MTMRGTLYSNDAIQGEKLTIKIVDAGGEISSFYVNPNLRRVLRRWDTRHEFCETTRREVAQILADSNVELAVLRLG